MKSSTVKIVTAIVAIFLAVLMGGGGAGYAIDLRGLLSGALGANAGLSADAVKTWTLVANLVIGPIVAGACGAAVLVVARRRFFPTEYTEKWRAWLFPAVVGLVSAALYFVIALLTVHL